MGIDSEDWVEIQDGWKDVSVNIRVPDGKRHESEDENPSFEVKGLHYRPLLEVIKSALCDTSAREFHWTPFKQFLQRSPGAAKERVIDELYSSDAFLLEHEKLQASPRENGCTLERAVVGLMFWSDSTHLTSFGTASLWPIYLFFGNQSKYIRSRPNSNSCHHVAYMPSLPDTIQDFFEKLLGQAATKEVITHCRRELIHAVWALLLDDAFMDAYVHGFVMKCVDGVVRRLFPRIFTYSADYPEKVLLASIKHLGSCPCPQCCIPKDRIHEMGSKLDIRRRDTLKRHDDDSRRRKVALSRK
ncbi:hypothetical protein BV22DRAFT_1027329, partial [Leucogyrophana mollusca]